jgi:diguanylate cyclase (GGDEF)-like protein
MNEEKKTISAKVIYGIILGVIALIFFVDAIFFTDAFNGEFDERLTYFSEGWTSSSGEVYNIDDIKVGDFDGGVVLTKSLPINLIDGDEMFFESKNVNIKVYLGYREIYRYETKENLTGKGYGVAFHEIGLSRQYAGQQIRIEYKRVIPDSTAGFVMKVYLGLASDYLRVAVGLRGPLALSSILISFFGCLMLLIYIAFSDKEGLPFDLVAFGVLSFFAGVWLLINSNIFQLLTGSVIVWRVISFTLIPLCGYPLVVFINSMTKLKRQVYNIIAFWISVLTESVMIATRYYYNMDMMNSLPYYVLGSASIILVIIVVMALDNSAYCKKNHTVSNLRDFHIGLILLFVISSLDGVVYFMKIGNTESYGVFVRIGMLVFIVYMLIQLMRWWARSQMAVDRDRFINRSLQFAVASKNPVESIKLMLEYLGVELGARRTYIYEDSGKGRFMHAYEWFEQGLDPKGKELAELPYKGCIDELERRFDAKEGCVFVDDVENIKDLYPIIYDRMKKGGASNVVLSPLEAGNKLIGLLGVNDVPPEHRKDVTEIIGIISYFFAQFINQRKEQERILYYSYHDTISGARNRNSLKEYTDEKMDLSQAFGYVICEIENLKEINETYGHDVGDELVSKTAGKLMETFGKENVYRLSGEEFVAFGNEIDEIYFNNDVERARRLLAELKYKVRIGAVYCSNGTTDIQNVFRYAHELMEQDKGVEIGR